MKRIKYKFSFTKINLPFPKIDKKISTTLLLKYGGFIDSEAIVSKEIYLIRWKI